MNLGENIYNLRVRHNMSQGDLAEALDVSRQSVSKWENNSAVPELDKLMKMAQIFGITIDELVTGVEQDKPAPLPPQPQERTAQPARSYSSATMFLGFPMLLLGIVLFIVLNSMGQLLFACMVGLPFLAAGIFVVALGLGAYYSDKKAQPNMQSAPAISQTQRTVGIVLLIAALAVFIVVSLLGGLLNGLLFSSPLYVPGLICLFCKKHAGLKCAWAEYFLIVSYFGFASGTSWNSFWTYLRLLLFSDANMEGVFNTTGFYLSFAEWVILVLLIIWTVCSYRDEVRPLRKRGIGFVIAGAVLYFALPEAIILLRDLFPIRLLSLLHMASSWLRVVLLTLFLVYLWPTAKEWVENH